MRNKVPSITCNVASPKFLPIPKKKKQNAPPELGATSSSPPNAAMPQFLKRGHLSKMGLQSPSRVTLPQAGYPDS